MGRNGVDGFVPISPQFSFLCWLMGLQQIFLAAQGVWDEDMLSPMLFLVMMEVFSRMLKRMDGAGLLCGFRANGRRGGGECVSRLLFADDTILFCDVVLLLCS